MSPNNLPNSYSNIIDSHFHTESMLQRGMDVFSLLSALFRQGFHGGIDIGCTHDDLPRRAQLLSPYPAILLSGAMGPWTAGSSSTNSSTTKAEAFDSKSLDVILSELDILKANLLTYKARFIGEIGLDYYWNYGTHEKQKLIFETQMKWADQLGLCVLIHDRDADLDTAQTIKTYGPTKGGIIHCFDGSESVFQAALDAGYFISFAGNLTYKSNTHLRDMLKRLPLDRLLLETDSPYLTPVPLRGTLNNPANIIHTYRCASKVLDIPLPRLAEIILSNFQTLCSR